jgi:hypothetical protein
MICHVSPAGRDQAAGTAADPLRTPAAGLAALRASGEPERILRLGGGTYRNVSLRLGPDDAGLAIEAAPGEAPVLSGSRRITGWEVTPEGLWRAALPGVQRGLWDFRTLLVDGRHAPPARLPREGVFEHESRFDVRWLSTTAGGWERPPTQEELTVLQYRAGDLGAWLEPRNAEVQVFHQWDESRVGVAAVDPVQRRLLFRSPAGHPPGAFCHMTEKASWYVLYNVRQGLCEPGQWLLDRARGELLYRPRPGQTPRETLVEAPAQRHVLRLAGEADRPVREIAVRGIGIRAANAALGAAGFGAIHLDGALQIEGPAEELVLEDLTVGPTAGTGIRLVPETDAPCRAIAIRRCRAEACGGPGLHGRGEACTVEDCRVRDAGRIFPSAIALHLGGRGHRIRHNEVCGCPYSAIVAGGEGMLIEKNLLRDFMQVLDDGAAIYCFAARETVYRGNVVLGTSGRTASAYYLDERSRGSTVEGNLAIDTAWPSHNHMAEACLLRRNVFLDAGAAKLTFMKSRDCELSENVIAAGGGLTLAARRADGLRRLAGNLLHGGAAGVRFQPLGEDGYRGLAPVPLPTEAENTLADPQAAVERDAEGIPRRVRFPAGGPAAAALDTAVADFGDAGPRR